MAEPTSTTLTLNERERDCLERGIVTAAPGMSTADRDVLLDIWLRVSKDTVAL